MGKQFCHLCATLDKVASYSFYPETTTQSGTKVLYYERLKQEIYSHPLNKNSIDRRKKYSFLLGFDLTRTYKGSVCFRHNNNTFVPSSYDACFKVNVPSNESLLLRMSSLTETLGVLTLVKDVNIFCVFSPVAYSSKAVHFGVTFLRGLETSGTYTALFPSWTGWRRNPVYTESNIKKTLEDYNVCRCES